MLKVREDIHIFFLVVASAIITLFSPFTSTPLADVQSGASAAISDAEAKKILGMVKHGFSRTRLRNTREGNPFGYSLIHVNPQNHVDSLKIIALRVEFRVDSSSSTTGNGLFGLFRNNWGTGADKKEKFRYRKYGGKAYNYDDLPHDSAYFASQLEFVKNYFWKVSGGHFDIQYEIYPRGSNEENAYALREKMTRYSPGEKLSNESTDKFWVRKTATLMEFFRDALVTADSSAVSPFRNLKQESDGSLWEIDSLTQNKKRVALVIFHAGSSFVTDNVLKDSRSDMIDIFASQELFEYYANSLPGFVKKGPTHSFSGVPVNKKLPNELVVNEVSLVSETANQDSLNYGIHGTLVNEIARQIGIPDLFSTSSGNSGVGAFCIMDAGFFNGQGFIPPYPSAWVRAFMGWCRPVIYFPQTGSITGNLKAVSSALPADTSIMLVPVNNHEYYLLENRQRNLTGNPRLFNWDTLNLSQPELKGAIVVAAGNPANLDNNVLNPAGHPGFIDSVYNFDIGLPASGVLVWHVDEYIIRDHLQNNFINADSSYRGVALEEADGVVDIGVTFQNMFVDAIFDYGGAADVYPHYTSNTKLPAVNLFGPFTKPATKSNDGGQSWLKLKINQRYSRAATEVSYLSSDNVLVYNYSDTIFTVTVSRDSGVSTESSNWPRRLAPSRYFDPVVCNVYSNGDTAEIAVIDSLGRVYIISGDKQGTGFGKNKQAVPTLLFSYDTVYSDTVKYLSALPAPAAMPTAINGSVYFPCKDGSLHILRSVDTASMAIWDSVAIGSVPTSAVCNYLLRNWAVGTQQGVVFGTDTGRSVNKIPNSHASPVIALASLKPEAGIVAAINSAGVLMAVSPSATLDAIGLKVPAGESFFAPFTLSIADLDQDSILDIVVTDRKQGVWLFNYNATSGKLSADPQWGNTPNDWASVYRTNQVMHRSAFPDNGSAPALADLDKDNILDIVIGGTNGVYALNRRGIPLVEWPAFLDKRYWYLRQSVAATPVIAGGGLSDPLVVFSAPTGENISTLVAHVDSANKARGVIYFTLKDGSKSDSATGLTKGFIDTCLIDSVVFTIGAPGGYVDAFNSHGKRVESIVQLPATGSELQSNWPLTVGGPITLSPLLCNLSRNGKTDIIALSDAGYLYRWSAGSSMVPNSFIWPQNGADNSRTFRYSGPVKPIIFASGPEIEYFYNYPNPVTRRDATATFKYRLSAPASSVRLDIFSFAGYTLVSEPNLPGYFGWNEYSVPVRTLGTGGYRCRLEVTFKGGKKVNYWKMAVIK